MSDYTMSKFASKDDMLSAMSIEIKQLRARVAELERATRDLVGILLRSGLDESPAIGPMIRNASAALGDAGEKGKGV